MDMAFVGGVVFVVLIGFIAYKVYQSKKKPSGGSGGGAKPGLKNR